MISSYQGIGLLSAVLLFGVLVEANPQSPTGVGLNDIRELAQAKSQAVDSLSFDCIRRFIRHVPQPPGKAEQSPMLDYVMESYMAEGDKRAYRCSYGRTEHEIVKFLMETWNGSNYKCYLSKDNSATIEGPIESNHGWNNNKFKVSVTPYDAVLVPILGDSTHMINKSIDVGLMSPGVSIREDLETIDDSPCLVVTNSDGTPILWLDTTRGFVVKQQDSRLSGPDVTKKRLYNEKFVEIAPGEWLPQTSRLQFFGMQASESPPKLLTENIYEFQNISVNKDIPDDVFDLQFPEGTRVSDKAAGIEYTIGEESVSEAMDVRLMEFRESTSELKPDSGPASDGARASGKDALKVSPYSWSNLQAGGILQIVILVGLSLIVVFLLVMIILRLRRRGARS